MKDTVNRMKMQATDGQKYLQNIYLMKNLYPKYIQMVIIEQ